MERFWNPGDVFLLFGGSYVITVSCLMEEQRKPLCNAHAVTDIFESGSCDYPVSLLEMPQFFLFD